MTEAGGRVTNLEGGAPDLEFRHIVATNRKLHRVMRETITKAWPEAVLREAKGPAVP